MRKSLFIFAICALFSPGVLAENNFFCENKPSSDSHCITISRIMYQGLLEGYAERMAQYNKEKGLPADIEQGKSEAQKLIPYDVFFESFKTCGESKKDIESAKVCIFSHLKDIALKNSEKIQKK